MRTTLTFPAGCVLFVSLFFLSCVTERAKPAVATGDPSANEGGPTLRITATDAESENGALHAGQSIFISSHRISLSKGDAPGVLVDGECRTEKDGYNYGINLLKILPTSKNTVLLLEGAFGGSGIAYKPILLLVRKERVDVTIGVDGPRLDTTSIQKTNDAEIRFNTVTGLRDETITYALKNNELQVEVRYPKFVESGTFPGDGYYFGLFHYHYYVSDGDEGDINGYSLRAETIDLRIIRRLGLPWWWGCYSKDFLYVCTTTKGSIFVGPFENKDGAEDAKKKLTASVPGLYGMTLYKLSFEGRILSRDDE